MKEGEKCGFRIADCEMWNFKTSRRSIFPGRLRIRRESDR